MPARRPSGAGRGRPATRRVVTFPVGRPTTRSATRGQQRGGTIQPQQPPAVIQQVQQLDAQQVQQPIPVPQLSASQDQPPIVQQPIASTSQGAVHHQDKDIISLSKQELSDLMEKAARKALENASHTNTTQDTSQIHAIDAAKLMTTDLLQGEETPIGIDHLTPKPPLAKFSMSVALDLHVSSTLRTKILNNEFVYLSDLLVRDRDRLNTSIQLSLSGQLVLQNNPRKIVNIDQWNEAFNIFSAIYCSKYTDCSSGLLKHATSVRQVHAKGGDWQYYDQQYRLFVQSGGCKWGEYHAEIYNNSMTNAPFRGQQNRTPPKRGFPSTSAQGTYRDREKYPLGYCWQFIDGKECKCDKSSPNARKHLCPRCNQKHALSQCQKTDKSKPNTQTK